MQVEGRWRATDSEHILRILGEAKEPLYAYEITDLLNDEPGVEYTTPEVVIVLKGLSGQVAQLSDGRWTLKRRMV